MSGQEDETEIKIEFFEPTDVDPLGELNPKITTKVLHKITSEIVSNVIINNESQDNISWYKHIDSTGKYVCKSCDLSYSTRQTLRNHLRKKHILDYEEMNIKRLKPVRKRKLKCHICKLQFDNIVNLKKHISFHGINNIQKSCVICHAIFEEESSMITHMSVIHNIKKNKLHFCFTCGYSTKKLSHFKQHENTHNKNNLKKCSYCDYATNYLPNLKMHERIHSNEKPYQCDYDGCNYHCTARSGLNSHKLKHDKLKNILYCDKCSYNTVYKNSLKKHIDSHSRSHVRKKYFYNYNL